LYEEEEDEGSKFSSSTWPRSVRVREKGVEAYKGTQMERD